MAYGRYSFMLDPAAWNLSHTRAFASVHPGARVLDIGASDGSVASIFTAMGCEVWGVELDPVWAQDARDKCARVICGDLETMDLVSECGDVTFDVVLLLDILEHLRDPDALLAKIAPLVADRGIVIASLPNVTHGAVRLKLLAGRFPYSDAGILDRTHLHFYDSVEAEDLFRRNGYTVIDTTRVVAHLTGTEIDVDPTEWKADFLVEMLKDPDAQTYQYIVISAPSGTAYGRRPEWATSSLVLERMDHLQCVLAATAPYADGVALTVPDIQEAYTSARRELAGVA